MYKINRFMVVCERYGIFCKKKPGNIWYVKKVLILLTKPFKLSYEKI